MAMTQNRTTASTATSALPPTEASTLPATGDTAGAVSSPPVGDLRPSFDVVADLARSVIAQVGESDLRRPTPCGEYDIGQLTAHLVSVMQRVAVVGRRGDPWSVPQEAPGLEPLGFLGGWDAAVVDQRSTWSVDSILGEVLDLPFGRLPGAIAIAVYVGEVLVHTWDLATACDVDVEWPAEIVEAAAMGARMNLPAEPRGGAIPFGDVVATAADAPPIDCLVAWMGRRP